MRVESSDIQLSGQRIAITKRVTMESLRAWVGAQRPDFEGQGTAAVWRQGSIADAADISAAARARFSTAAAASSQPVQETTPPEADIEADADPKIRLLRLLVEIMTGRKIKVLSLRDVRPDSKTESLPKPQRVSQGGPPARQGYGVEYDYHESYSETENTTFSASGVIKTTDGKDITFTVGLTMSRQFATERSVSIRAGDAAKKDPLVINFDGTAAQLSGASFSFDLDADGKLDQVPFVGRGSGFLALDGNNDGTINNGSELFGTRTGDGFAELSAYDADRNGWIDENDPIFGSLQVWSRDAQGNDGVVALTEKGVGAIYLGSAGTQFDIKDTQNELLGQVRASGIYVNENGSVGTVQQVDLAVLAGQGEAPVAQDAASESDSANAVAAAPDSQAPQETDVSTAKAEP